MTLFVIRKLALETGMDIIRTPLWWYRKGLITVVNWWIYMARRGNSRLGVILWLRNLFVPMFGQHDWQGRLISIFMRIANIVGRSIAFVVWFLFISTALILWLTAPFLILVGLILSLAG